MHTNTNSKGFSLTELMLVVGLMGIVMLGTMRLFQDAFKTQNRVEAGQDVILITDQLARILNDAPTCTNLIKGSKGDNGSPVMLGTALYDGAQVGKVTLTSLSLSDVSELTDDVFLAKVLLKGKKSKDGSGQFSRELPLVFRTDERGYIKECLGDNFGLAGNCKGLGGKWDNQKMECDLCSALGGELSAGGRCQLAGTPIANCPMQKAFGANSTSGVCSDRWDADFVADSVDYLSSFSHIKPETLDWFKSDLQKALDNPPESELPTKSMGGRGKASWVISIEPQNKTSGKACSALVYFTVNCP